MSASLSQFIDPQVDSSYTDWRDPTRRLEAFARVCHVRMVEGDLDHHHVGKVIADQMNLDNDAKVLYSLLFGQSYRNHHAMIQLQLFPELLTYDNDKYTDWHNQNWQRLKFAKDTKWGVRKVPAFVKDIRDKFGTNLYETFGNIANSGTTAQNYKRLNDALQSLYGIGRMTAWLAQQTLYEFFDWGIDHWDQQLYDSATWSQWGALAYLFNDDRLADKCHKITKEDVKLMEDRTIQLMEYCNERIPFHVDIYNVESCECEYRKTAAREKPKEFTFWTSKELEDQYSELKALWADYETAINWEPYLIGFMTKGKNVRSPGWHPEYFNVVKGYGLNLNTHCLYKDEPNAHRLLDLPCHISSSAQEMRNEWNCFSKEEQQALQERYNPVRYLKFKPKDHPAWSDPNVDYSYAEGFA